MTKILFICTGNIYRSRYAEAYLNHTALKQGLPVKARSRGLAIEMAKVDTSPLTIDRMAAKGIARSCTGSGKIQLHEKDFLWADTTVVLQEDEHRPMMQRQFPAWVDRVTYWDVHDVGMWDPEEGLSRIEQLVSDLLNEILSQKVLSQKSKL